LAFFFSAITSPVPLEEARALGSTVTSPPLLTSRTCLNSTGEPAGRSRRSTLITCPGATRYCLPPVAITASMRTCPDWLGVEESRSPKAEAEFHPRERLSDHGNGAKVKKDAMLARCQAHSLYSVSRYRRRR